MPLFALFFVLLYFTCMLGALIVPHLGIWGFIIESNFHPPNNWWGKTLPFQMGGRWNFYIGAAMIGSVALHWSSYSKVKVFGEKKTWILIAFLAYTLLVSLGWAIVPDLSQKEVSDAFKWFLVYVCIVKTQANSPLLRVILLIYLFSAIKMGWDQTWSPKSGRNLNMGTTTCHEVNFLAAHVVLLLPIGIGMFLTNGIDKRIRVLILLGLPFMMNLFAHASSRGAMIAAMVALIASVFIVRGPSRRVVWVTVLLGAIGAVRLLHEEFINRFFSISEYEEDGSAMGRVYAWKAAWKAFQENPFGYGAEAFDNGLGAKFMPDGFVTTHNMYFEILVAWGAVGLVLFLWAIGISMKESYSIYKMYYNPRRFQQSLPAIEAAAIFIAFVSILVSSVFLNRMRYEMWWILMAYSTCLKYRYLNTVPNRDLVQVEVIDT